MKTLEELTKNRLVYYVHKELNVIISLEDLKNYRRYDNFSFCVTPRLMPTEFTGFEPGKVVEPKTYTYRVDEIPFSDDWYVEVLDPDTDLNRYELRTIIDLVRRQHLTNIPLVQKVNNRCEYINTLFSECYNTPDCFRKILR